MTGPATIPLEDRLPTIAEIENFDAGAAWDRLTPEQQRAVGMLAVRWGTIGIVPEFICDPSKPPANWSAEQIAMSIDLYPHRHRIEDIAQQSFTALGEPFDALWPQLFGWTSTPTTKGELQR
jgi:hypothetical protein